MLGGDRACAPAASTHQAAAETCPEAEVGLAWRATGIQIPAPGGGPGLGLSVQPGPQFLPRPRGARLCRRSGTLRPWDVRQGPARRCHCPPPAMTPCRWLQAGGCVGPEAILGPRVGIRPQGVQDP